MFQTPAMSSGVPGVLCPILHKNSLEFWENTGTADMEDIVTRPSIVSFKGPPAASANHKPGQQNLTPANQLQVYRNIREPITPWCYR